MIVPSTEQRIQTICLMLLTTFAVAITLYWLSAVMIPFVLALFVAFAIRPGVNFLTRHAKVPRPIAIAGVFIVGSLFLGLAGVLVSSSVTQLSENAGAYQTTIQRLSTSIVQSIPLDRFGLDTSSLQAQLSGIPIGSVLVGLTNAILQILSNAILVLIFLIFLLIGSGKSVEQSDPVWDQIEYRIERYVIAKVLISATTGMLVSGILYALGVELALMFGFLAFLLNFIPSVGSIIATLLPLPVIILNPDISTTTVVLALVLPGIVQVTIGNGLEPKIMGDSLDLHPISILFALIVWGVLWGIVGMFLATPITAVLKILLEQHELTRPVAELMAGRFSTAEAKA